MMELWHGFPCYSSDNVKRQHNNRIVLSTVLCGSHNIQCGTGLHRASSSSSRGKGASRSNIPPFPRLGLTLLFPLNSPARPLGGGVLRPDIAAYDGGGDEGSALGLRFDILE